MHQSILQLLCLLLNIQNSFFNSDYVYVAATGLPNYKVGPFTGTALIPGNQRKLLRFPRTVTTVSKRETIAPNSAIGSWVNGVSIWSYKSSDFVRFGPITSVDINNGGQGYDAGSKPAYDNQWWWRYWSIGRGYC